MSNRESASHTETEFDLLVVGAGVFGSLLALEASQRGLKTLLVDHGDLGGMTSSNSLKTIHGGLRYLQNLDFRSSLISSKERGAWLRMMPGLVRPLQCMLPTTNSLMKSPLVVGAGMAFYNLITRSRNEGMSSDSVIPDAGLASLETLADTLPSMDIAGLKGAGVWYDAQAVNTERAVISACNAAAALGATIKNYTQIKDLRAGGKGFQFEVDQVTFDTRFVFDCTGANSYLEREGLAQIDDNYVFQSQDPIAYVKAVNLIVKSKLATCAFGFKARLASGSERLLFAAPWRPCAESPDYTLLGTWYFEVESAPQQTISDAELDMCLQELNTAFKEFSFERADVVQTHVGFLPAAAEKLKQKGPDASLVKSEVIMDLGADHCAFDGLFVVKGTKYTLARHGAERAINMLQAKYDLRIGESISSKTALWVRRAETEKMLASVGLSESQILFVTEHFYQAADVIVELCERSPGLNEGVPGASYCPKVIFEYCIQQEWVVTLVDLLVRRVPIGAAELPPSDTIEFAVRWLAAENMWTESRQALEVANLSNYYIKLANRANQDELNS